MPVTSTRPKPSSIPPRRTPAGGGWRGGGGSCTWPMTGPRARAPSSVPWPPSLPGELAPRLALAVALELSAAGPGYDGHGGITEPTLTLRQSEHYYGIVSATDPSYASAAFGLSRVRLALGTGREPSRRCGGSRPFRARTWLLRSVVPAPVRGCRRQCTDPRRPHRRLRRARQARRRAVGAPTPRARPPRQALRLLEDGDVAADAGIVLAGNPSTSRPTQRDGADVASLAKLAPTDKERCQLVTRPTTSDPDVHMTSPSSHRTATEQLQGVCPHCGAAVLVHERFCEVCGSPLAGTGPTAPPSQAAVPRAEFIAERRRRSRTSDCDGAATRTRWP